MFSKFRFWPVLATGWLGFALLLAACGDSATTAIPTTLPPAATPTTIPATVAAPVTPVSISTTLASTTAPAVSTVAPTTTLALATTSVVTPDPAQVSAGLKVFSAQCNGCHIQNGTVDGGYGPNLATSQKALDPNYVRGNVRNGKGLMVPFGKDQVSDSDLENIIQYLKSIHKA